MAILFDVAGQKLSPASNTFMASKTIEYPELIFNFDSEWDGFSKVATFQTSNSELYYKIIVNNQCTVPAEVMVDNELISVGVYGTKDNVRITTNIIELMCYKSGYGTGTEPTEQSADLISQVYELTVQMEQSINAIEKKNLELELVQLSVQNEQSNISNTVNTSKSDIIDRIDTAESSIKTEVIGSKTAVLNKLGSGAITIDDRIDNAKSDINDNIDTAKNSLSSKITSSLLSVDIWLTNVQTALYAEIEDVREEFEDKYDELMYEMKKSEKTILREIKSLADELAVGNSVITGQSTLLMQGEISQSYAGTITRGDS